MVRPGTHQNTGGHDVTEGRGCDGASRATRALAASAGVPWLSPMAALDASILTAAAASILWMLVIEPIVADSTQAPLQVLIATAYPLADIVILGLLLRILLDRHGSNTALLLFASGVGAFLMSDLIYSVLAVDGT